MQFNLRQRPGKSTFVLFTAEIEEHFHRIVGSPPRAGFEVAVG